MKSRRHPAAVHAGDVLQGGRARAARRASRAADRRPARRGWPSASARSRSSTGSRRSSRARARAGRYAIPGAPAALSRVPRRRGDRTARRLGRDGAARLPPPPGCRARRRDAVLRRRDAGTGPRPRGRARDLRRGRGRLRRLRPASTARRCSSSGIASGRCCRWRSSTRRSGARAISRCSADRARRRALPRRCPQPRVDRDRARARAASLRATLAAFPSRAPFFGDHFPRRPVFPGTLLLDRQIELALELAREARAGPGARARARARDRREDALVHRAGRRRVEIRVELQPQDASDARPRASRRAVERQDRSRPRGSRSLSRGRRHDAQRDAGSRSPGSGS